MQKNNKLPDDVQQLEYISMKINKRPKLYVIKGFEIQENALQRMITFLSKKNNPSALWMEYIQNHDWCVIFDETLLPYVTKKEETALCRTSYPTPIIQYTPRVFRYMDEQYIDEFFNKGRLRLSSFASFKKHENSNLRDENEGEVTLIMKFQGYKSEARLVVGHSSFVLCGTHMDNEQNYDTFSTNAAFSIENIQGFCEAISAAIKKKYGYEILYVNQGPCKYMQSREHEVDVFEYDYKEIMQGYGINESSVNFDTMQKMNSQYLQEHGFFLKQNKYALEYEYRMLWHIEEDEIPEFIDVTVPEAVKFCKKHSKVNDK